MPGEPVVLETLGGLVATARPEDLPEGASPRTYDTDYIVGRVIQRAGLNSVYSYASGPTFGANHGGNAADTGPAPVLITPPPPPFPPAAGESVAWSIATVVSAPEVISTNKVTGQSNGTFTSGSLGLIGGDSFQDNQVDVIWSNFSRPIEIPAGAVITRVIPVAVVSGRSVIGANTQIVASFPGGAEQITFAGTATAGQTNTAMNVGTWINVSLHAFIQNTLVYIGVPPDSLSLLVSFIGLAVYYEGTPTGPPAPIVSTVTGVGNPWSNPGNVTGCDGSFATSAVISSLATNNLQVTDFNFTVPGSVTIFGIEVSITGYAPDTTLQVGLIKNGVPATTGLKTVMLPTTPGTVTVGGPSDLWGQTWLFSDIDATDFGVDIIGTALTPSTVAIDCVTITIFGVEGGVNFTGLFSANLNDPEQVTLALDADGFVWQEDVTGAPGVLARATLIPEVVPGSYMKGLDAEGIAYMAYSDLTQGTSQPMQYTGEWCDRITQVGPGAAPIFTPVASTTDTFAITSITQNPANSDITDPGHLSVVLQSAGPGSTAPGNVITVYYSPGFYGGAIHPEAEDMVLDNAFNSGQAVYVYISGSTFANGTFLVTSVGNALPPGVDHQRFYFTVQSPTIGFQRIVEDTGQYQMTVATMTMAVPVPGLSIGNLVTITGTSVAAWDAQWPISETLNSSTMVITNTSVTGSVATYNYSLTGGSLVAPVAGQLVTITGTTNANGALNGANLTIVSASGGSSGTFTINVPIVTATSNPEAGQATTEGSIFAFDPGLTTLGTSMSPIFGNSTGGSLTFVGADAQLITAGIKQGTVFFITRNGAVTAPANPVTFTIPINTTSIVATQIPIGPPNVIARGISFTESGQNGEKGANFYTYDTSEQFQVNGIDYIATALIVNDNTSTTATFTFPDTVLLASDEIDIQGNNYFNLIEIGSPAWMFQYAQRMMYGLCQTKIQNFINMSFDGGYLPGLFLLPLGWSAIPNSDAAIGLVPSPDFGNTLQILNTGSAAISGAYIFYQAAFQDFNGVNILQINTSYSVRLKGRSLNADGQILDIKLVPYASGIFNIPLGVASFRLNQGEFTIQTELLIGPQAVIPPTLQLAIAINSLDTGAGIQIDRIEVFETDRPVDTTTIWTSYAGKFEAVDVVTGQLGVGDDNPQPATGAYQILENLYINKTASRVVTQDSPNYEPNQWKVPLASQGVGSIGPNASYSEEEFSIDANRSGLFLFDGGKPMPISRELQSTGVNGSIWETIDWNLAKTIWCRYSTDKRQLYVGVPMKLPNFWIPNAPAFQQPLQGPNVILMCNFTGVPMAEELAAGIPVHTTIFGDLKALDMRRKWSIWQIQSPIAEFITRADAVSTPLFLGNGISSSKIYQLIDGAPAGGQNTDDGMAINWLYTTYGFVKAKQGQQVQSLGALRKVWYYFAATMEGIGQVARKFYSNSLGAKAQNTYTAPPATLSYPQQNDQECVLEIGGQRLFVEFSSIGTGGYAEVGPVILDGEMDRNAPHRGVSA